MSSNLIDSCYRNMDNAMFNLQQLLATFQYRRLSYKFNQANLKRTLLLR